MKWKHFYQRIMQFQKNPIEYYIDGNLLEIKILTPPNDLPKDAMDFLAEYGHLHILKYLVSKKIYPTSMTATVAAGFGHLEMFKYILSLGIQPTPHVASLVSQNGHIEILKYLREKLNPD